MHKIIIIVTIIAIMWKRSDNNSDSDSDNRAKW